MTVDFAFGDAGGGPGILPMGLPLLGGDPRERLSDSAEAAGTAGPFRLWRSGGTLLGYSSVPGGGLEEVARRTYAELLKASSGLNLHRIWNCVPGINGTGPGGLENYRAFCRARSLAFEAALGPRFSASLPAASAVGARGDDLIVAFIAGEWPARNHENPAQTPAYDYPPEHGPRPPSFARATSVDTPGGRDVFISGTSAIVGHETVAPGDIRGQLDCTLGNLRLISRECGLGDDLGRGARRHFKVYVRNAPDLGFVERELGARLLASGDRVSYLGADICRAELGVEIEVAVRGAARN